MHFASHGQKRKKQCRKIFHKVLWRKLTDFTPEESLSVEDKLLSAPKTRTLLSGLGFYTAIEVPVMCSVLLDVIWSHGLWLTYKKVPSSIGQMSTVVTTDCNGPMRSFLLCFVNWSNQVLSTFVGNYDHVGCFMGGLSAAWKAERRLTFLQIKNLS